MRRNRASQVLGRYHSQTNMQLIDQVGIGGVKARLQIHDKIIKGTARNG